MSDEDDDDVETSTDGVEQEQEQTPNDTAIFDKVLQEQYGITPDQFKQGIEYVTQQMGQKQAATGLAELQDEWGVAAPEVNQRLALVQQYWSNLPPAQQKELDNIPGAMYIWNQIQKTNGAKTSTRTGGSTGGVPQSSYDFTVAQIDSMSESDLKKYDKQITAAYAAGRVKGA